ncbi:ParB/RepB/Spo0J family partition protein [Sphingobium indicum]
MSKQPTRTASKTPAKATAKTSKAAPAAAATAKPKPRATFAAASFGNLRAATGEGQGEALRILLADIDEDPNQPRKVFADDELESMAESIKTNGVVQPIVVRPPVEGRYMLAFGARRFRASKLAGVRDIPAVIRAKSDDDFTAQVIENQHRANLSNSDLAAAIEQLAGEGKTNKQIGVICSLKDYQVAAFRQAPNFPTELRDRIDNADMRALYDLFRQWGKTPEQVIEALPDAETFITVTEARRIIGGITGKPTGSIVLDRQAAAAAAPEPEPAPEVEPAAEPNAEPEAPASSEPSPPPAPASAQPRGDASGEGYTFQRTRPTTPPAEAGSSADQGIRATMAAELAKADEAAAAAASPVFIVQRQDDQEGRLVVDRRAEREGWALVAFAEGIEEVELSALRFVRIE